MIIVHLSHNSCCNIVYDIYKQMQQLLWDRGSNILNGCCLEWLFMLLCIIIHPEIFFKQNYCDVFFSSFQENSRLKYSYSVKFKWPEKVYIFFPLYRFSSF